MATTISRTLASRNSITHIRPSVVTIRLRDSRPNTKMFVFFDGENVNEYCQPVDTSTNMAGELNADIITDSSGECSFVFNIIANRWLSGDREIIVSDVADQSLLLIPGNVYGKARAVYETRGTLEVYNNTRTITTTVNQFTEITPPERSDPVAQSFFTHGISGGCFITSLDLYFQSKDDAIPVRVEIRKMENGFPSEFSNWNKDAYATRKPEDVHVSNTGFVPTRFVFNAPIYLEEDKDYCFVVMTNSNKYNIWTSRMGEKSIETGRTIFSQPYVGSMFKSQNNYTWTPEQTEDVKFKLNRAKFDTTSSSDLTFIAAPIQHTASGKLFTTFIDSAVIRFTSTEQHGLGVGSKFKIDGDEEGTYNGIPGASFVGVWNVSRVISDYILEFIVGSNATSSGKIESGGIIRGIFVVDGGTNYTNATSITISQPAVGTAATANPVVINGKISRVEITSKGSGYVNDPIITISGAGTGAQLKTSVIPNFVITVNKKVNHISPQFITKTFQDTNVTSTIKTTTEGYGVGAIVNFPTDRVTALDKTALIASRTNEFSLMNNSNSFEMNIGLTSSNENVSPVIDMRTGVNIFAYTNAINSQSTTDDLSSNVATSGVSGVTLTSGGAGYLSVPIVTVTAAETEISTEYFLPTITATILNGSVSGLNLIAPGAGFTVPPLLTIEVPQSGTAATGYVDIFPINSEIKTKGKAYSRYLTKKIQLKTVSESIRLNCLLSSVPETSVDWYIRTSLSSDSTIHTDNPWVLLKCDEPRNKSSSMSDYREYTFYANNMSPFDVYDLKMVPSSTVPSKIPFVKKYQAITLA